MLRGPLSGVVSNPHKGVVHVRVLIADDHPLVREALAAAVRLSRREAVITDAASVAEAEEAARLRGPFQLVVLDLVLPDAHGFSGLISLQRLEPRAKIVIISGRQDALAVATAYHLGAAAYLSKSTPMTEIGRTLDAVLKGERAFPLMNGAEASATADIRRKLDQLSAAQLRILLALADGRLNKQIAADMNLTEATVKAHLTAIFRKLGVSNRTQAILLAQPLLSDGEA